MQGSLPRPTTPDESRSSGGYVGWELRICDGQSRPEVRRPDPVADICSVLSSRFEEPVVVGSSASSRTRPAAVSISP